MADFTVRVELHNHQAGDYDRLHAAMERAGYSRQIQGEDGKRFHLPTAEYRITSLSSCATIRDQAAQIGDSVRTGCWVLVTESVRAYWRTATV